MDDVDTLIVMIVIVMLAFVSLAYCDANYSMSYTKVILPKTIVIKDHSNMVMDECFNTYIVYENGMYGESDSATKLLYCKENNMPCEITVMSHVMSTGVKSVKILNTTSSESCKGEV